MANDDIVDAEDLIELARSSRLLVLRLDGIKGERGVLHRIEAAGEVLDRIDSKLGPASQLSKQIESLPERLLKPADEMQLRALLQENIAKALAGAIDQARLAAIDIGDEAGREQAKATALEVFGEAVDLRADLEVERQHLDAVRKMLSERDGALQHSRAQFFGSIEDLTNDYTTHAKTLSDAFTKATTKAVNRINAQNAWLPLKYAIFTFGGFVAGFAAHDSIYLP